ncbi:hypothetical protein L226DRAFT_175494 [Lentinus tigrinus ALCF2SS1-7]|uniref:uncharacterized protein n=1 Tax=Lentinus tigrinus ALCF2SS1-7 TaxID=1328758 RepID=UPI001165FDAB|nr:hypothetical protein L226DRAFT_175494 [Lentinus tigrinus ALCF2SS1-7]
MYGRSFRFFLSFSFLSSPLLPSASVCFAADSEFVCINEKVCVWTYTLYADVTHCTARRARDARPQGSTEGSEVGYLGWEAKNRMHMDMSLPLPLLVKKGYDIGSVQRVSCSPSLRLSFFGLPVPCVSSPTDIVLFKSTCHLVFNALYPVDVIIVLVKVHACRRGPQCDWKGNEDRSSTRRNSDFIEESGSMVVPNTVRA